MSVDRPTVRERPWWATTLSGFCMLTVVFLAGRDLLVPQVRDTEVWFGFELRGWPAMLTAPFHWLVFGLGAWGFFRLRPWVWPWASAYAFTIALSHLVWNISSPSGAGWVSGFSQLGLFSIPAVLLLWARPTRLRHTPGCKRRPAKAADGVRAPGPRE